MDDRAALDILQRVAVFQHMASDDLENLLPYCRHHHFAPGATIIQEGDDTRHLYIILEGEVGVFKTAVAAPEVDTPPGAAASEYQIGVLRVGEVVGEMSFIDAVYTRSASIRALSPTHLLSISHEAFETIAQTHLQTAYTLLLNLARLTSRHLQRASDTAVAALQSDLDQANTRAAMGRFMSYVVILLFAYNLTLGVTIPLSKTSYYANLISFATVAIFGLMLGVMVRQSGYSLRTYGMTLYGWRRSVREALWLTLGLIGLLTLAKWIWIQQLSSEVDIPLFGPYQPQTVPEIAFTFGMYTLLAPVQEFISRGVMQTSFAHFYTGKHKTLLAILVSNSLFCAAHVHLSAGFAALVFAPGLLWGYLYARHGTLIGVSLSHILVGLYAVFILKLSLLIRLLS